ncbi:MAG: hypothetical protein M1834_001467 [Cirrosporium novae-zelandiae]|nr:MAG: hypothetical protein M1834_008627 [Cirrosporium novae-zelandiae]KAI9736001.1 MAG: hypothetical protein M1834_001467 [Cirrosporium novae-zelandiae]
MANSISLAMNSDWDSSKFDTTDLGKSVITVHICGYTNQWNKGDETGRPPANHWTAFLELSGRESVRLDMAAGYGSDGRRGELEICSKPYPSTKNAIKMVSFTPLGAPTVKTIQ